MFTKERNIGQDALYIIAEVIFQKNGENPLTNYRVGGYTKTERSEQHQNQISKRRDFIWSR
ncbi:hypothetical protein [Paenibacillus solani]|uniref:hypothetical protein n=1 Tax=Paenibacillus solani TaxID=1705565 RepID=UPI003D2BAECD